MAATQQQIDDCLAAADVWNEKVRLAQRAAQGVNETVAALDNTQRSFETALRFNDNAAVREALLTLLVEYPKLSVVRNSDLTAALTAQSNAKTDYDDAFDAVKNA